MLKKLVYCCAPFFAVAQGISTSIAAPVQLEFRLEGLPVQAQNTSLVNTSFSGQNFSGRLQFGNDSNAQLVFLRQEGPNLIGSPINLTAVSGFLDLVNGFTTGGTFSFSTGSGPSLSTYTSSLEDGGIKFNNLAPFSLPGFTYDGALSGSSFASVDVSPWFAGQPLEGEFSFSNYSPNNAGFAADTSLTLVAIVPEPASGVVLLMAASCMAIRRRVRKA